MMKGEWSGTLQVTLSRLWLHSFLLCMFCLTGIEIIVSNSKLLLYRWILYNAIDMKTFNNKGNQGVNNVSSHTRSEEWAAYFCGKCSRPSLHHWNPANCVHDRKIHKKLNRLWGLMCDIGLCQTSNTIHYNQEDTNLNTIVFWMEFVLVFLNCTQRKCKFCKSNYVSDLKSLYKDSYILGRFTCS
jgi:hypothetical protein